jgi:phosphatidylserine decarboxylase
MAVNPVIQGLKNYLEENPNVKDAFELAFQIGKATGVPEFKEYNINNLDDYINFYNELLTWIPSENLSGNNIMYHLCMFYFIIDLPPVKYYQNPILPGSVPPLTFLSGWLVSYAMELGKFLSTPESINAETLATFYAAKIYRMEDYEVPPGGWKTFNGFFSRKLKPGLRPIDGPGDPTVIVSPADSHFDGQWPVNSNAEVVIKQIPWPISELLAGSEFASKFVGGTFIHSFLAPYNYHRQHSPVAGHVVETKNIQALCYLQVDAKADANGKMRMKMRRELEAPDDAGYQFIQTRGLVVIKTPDIGHVAVLPMGMAQVSSVVITIKNGQNLEKGQEISYFQFGGSDIVCVFEPNVKVTATVGAPYNYGQQIATATLLHK